MELVAGRPDPIHLLLAMKNLVNTRNSVCSKLTANACKGVVSVIHLAKYVLETYVPVSYTHLTCSSSALVGHYEFWLELP